MLVTFFPKHNRQKLVLTFSEANTVHLNMLYTCMLRSATQLSFFYLRALENPRNGIIAFALDE